MAIEKIQIKHLDALELQFQPVCDFYNIDRNGTDRGASLKFNIVFPEVPIFIEGYKILPKLIGGTLYVNIGKNKYYDFEPKIPIKTVFEKEYLSKTEILSIIKDKPEFGVRKITETTDKKTYTILSFCKHKGKPGWNFSNLHLVNGEIIENLELKLTKTDKINSCYAIFNFISARSDWNYDISNEKFVPFFKKLHLKRIMNRSLERNISDTLSWRCVVKLDCINCEWEIKDGGKFQCKK